MRVIRVGIGVDLVPSNSETKPIPLQIRLEVIQNDVYKGQPRKPSDQDHTRHGHFSFIHEFSFRADRSKEETEHQSDSLINIEKFP